MNGRTTYILLDIKDRVGVIDGEYEVLSAFCEAHYEGTSELRGRERR
jgi:hypothetical protein